MSSFSLSNDTVSTFSIYSRIAKDAMSLQEKFDMTAIIPDLYVYFYGRIAWRFEPLQAGIDKLRQGFEAGLSSGHADMGLHSAVQVIKNTICMGANLTSILKEIDYYLHTMETYKSAMGRTFMLIFRETVSTLIDNGEATGIGANPSVGDLNDQKNKFRESVLYHSAIRCYWLGHTERCRYYSEKCMIGMKPVGHGGNNIMAHVATFFIGKLQLEPCFVHGNERYLISSPLLFILCLLICSDSVVRPKCY